MKKATFNTMLVLIVGLLSSAAAEDKIDHTKDSLETVKKNLQEQKAVLLDVREKSEWDAGHLQAAILVPLTKLKEGTDPKTIAKELDTKKIVYCHCKAGKRALTAAEILKKHGYDVRPLKQGYDELLE